MNLSVKNLSKEYKGFSGFADRLACVLSLGLYPGSIRFRALDDLSFEMGAKQSGEILGIIGPNGAGKSTLLRILTGISRPMSGSIEFSGSLRSILELGVGFSPDLTGRENIYYNGRLWGYTGRQLLDATNEILDFARLREYGDWPLGSWSTGMQMRLAFSLATFERSDLLIIDEALSVGDASFQQRCIDRFEQFKKAGSLIVIVSHDLPLLQAISDKILLIDRGKMISCGIPSDTISDYMDLIASGSRQNDLTARSFQSEEFEISIRDEHGQNRQHFFVSEKITLEIILIPEEKLKDITIGIHLHNANGVRVFGINSRQILQRGIDIPGRLQINFLLELNLGPGQYAIGCSVHRGLAHAQDCYLWEDSVTEIEIETRSDLPFEGTSYLKPSIEILPD